MSVESLAELWLWAILAGLVVWLAPTWWLWRRFKRAGVLADEWGYVLICGGVFVWGYWGDGPEILMWLIFGDEARMYTNPFTGQIAVMHLEEPGVGSWIKVFGPWVGFIWGVRSAANNAAENEETRE